MFCYFYSVYRMYRRTNFEFAPHSIIVMATRWWRLHFTAQNFMFVWLNLIQANVKKRCSVHSLDRPLSSPLLVAAHLLYTC